MISLPNTTTASLTEAIPFTPKQSFLILLIDDDVLIRTQLRRFLEKEKYQVIEAGNGQEGLDAYQRLRPDLVLLDAVMPEMDGFECCAQLQTLPNAVYTPVLMITGLNDQQSVDRAFDAGAIDYVTKPIHWSVLRQRVSRLIQQSQLCQQLEAANHMLQRLVLVDSLTQIANRRHFDDCFQQAWRRLAREQLPLALILCDVDFFKRYNDAYGHQAGDEYLRQIAQALKVPGKRPADLVARYGGEEFVVLLPNTDRGGAIHIAEQIQAQVATLRLAHDPSPKNPSITLSFGVASMIPDLTASGSTLIRAADEALYRAKAAGRDQIKSFGESVRIKT